MKQVEELCKTQSLDFQVVSCQTFSNVLCNDIQNVLLIKYLHLYVIINDE